MFYLHWDANDFGINAPTVKAPYATLDDAIRQAEHDLALGRHPLYIVDEQDTRVWVAHA